MSNQAPQIPPEVDMGWTYATACKDCGAVRHIADYGQLCQICGSPHCGVAKIARWVEHKQPWWRYFGRDDGHWEFRDDRAWKEKAPNSRESGA